MEGWDSPCWLVVEYFSHQDYSRPVGQVSPGAVTHLVSSSGMGRAHRPIGIPELGFT